MASITGTGAIIRDTDSDSHTNAATTVENGPQTKRSSPRRTTAGRRILANLLCSECHSGNTSPQSTTDSPPYRLLLPPSARKRSPYLSPITDQTLDFCASYSSTACNCNKCPKEDFKFVTVRSFSRSNISSSTHLDYTTSSSSGSDSRDRSPTASSNVSHTTEEIGNFFTPPREYTNNCRALGILTEKRSPIFGPLAGGISLRTQEPFYSEYLLNANDLISPKSLKAFKENIDYTATEALPSMNGGKRSMNGSVTASPATNGANVTDINRNGVPKHWDLPALPDTMQNTDVNDNIDSTNKKFETWPGTQPASLELLPSAVTTAESSNPELVESSRAIHSDPEERQTKEKVRSRFSSALRKLSRSTRKKDKSAAIKGSLDAAASDVILSSDADDIASGEQLPVTKVKTKKKKSSLFGLKKSKVAPKKDCGEEEPQTLRILEPLFHDTENEVVVTTERLSPTEGKRKVQITIKSKKIEKVADTADSTERRPTSPSPSPALSQPSPSTTPTTTPPLGRALKNDSDTNATTTTPAREDKKKTLKGKLKTQTSQKPTKPTQPQTKKEEKIVITQSSKDIPPRDKAPAKPSRLAQQQQPQQPPSTSHSTCTSSNTNTGGAVRKTATTTRAAIKLVTAAKSKKKSEANKTNAAKQQTGGGKGSATKASDNNTNAATTTTAAAVGDNTDSDTKESDLMINPQRGHRFPRPTSTESTDRSHEAVGTPDSKNSAISASPPSPQATAPLPATATAADSNLTPPNNPATQPQRNEIQSVTDSLSATNASLPANQASPSAHQQTSTPPPPPQQPSPTSQDKSVHILTPNQTDDHISLAESAQPSATSTEDIIPKDTTSVHPTVRFTLGNRVRPPLIIAKQLAYEPSSQEPYSIEHHSDDDDSDDTPDSDDSRRRRIRYIATTPSGENEPPTLYDEFNNLELKRKYFRYHSGVSDLSLDSHNNEDIQKLNTELQQQMPAFGDLTMDQECEPTIMTSANAEKREHLYKILVIGELGTGKTSFIKRYVHQFFSQNYRATIGVDFALKVLHWDPNTIVRLQLWDIAGQERFGNMTRVYYKEAVGAFIVFDVTRSGTFDCVSKWKEDLDSKVQLPDGSPIPCILLANKCDQDKQGMVTNAEKMDEYVKEHGFAGWFETSAKENINIDEAARALVNKILLNDKLISAADLADSEKFNLNQTGDQTLNDEKSKCSC